MNLSRVAPDAAVWILILSFAVSAGFLSRAVRRKIHSLGLVLALALALRVALVLLTPGNYDQVSWRIAADAFMSGRNVYEETARYNYSPIWFWILGVLAHAKGALPADVTLSVMIRLFLCVVDALIVRLLWTWPGRGQEECQKAAFFFAFNPVSILLTSVHGPFDALAILIFCAALRALESGRRSRAFAWATLGAALKQLYGILWPTILCHAFKSWRGRALAGLAAFVATASLFLPYARESAWAGILKNVIFYASYPMPYGVGYLGLPKAASAACILLILLYSVRVSKEDPVRAMRKASLFFLVFTPGLGVQYFLLPIVWASFAPRREAVVFSVLAGLYLAGSDVNLAVRALHGIPLGLVWAAAALWWVREEFYSVPRRPNLPLAREERYIA